MSPATLMKGPCEFQSQQWSSSVTANYSSCPHIRTQVPNAAQDTAQDAMQMAVHPNNPYLVQ